MPLLNLAEIKLPIIPNNTKTTPTKNKPKMIGISIKLLKYLYFSIETTPVLGSTAKPSEKSVQITKVKKNTTKGSALNHKFFLERFSISGWFNLLIKNNKA